jgi:hypothetical protein
MQGGSAERFRASVKPESVLAVYLDQRLCSYGVLYKTGSWCT